MVKLAVNIAGLAMKNPFTVASGTFASGKEYAQIWADAVDGISVAAMSHTLNAEKPLSILGAITTKGVSAKPWAGNSGTRIDETALGMLNSIGLQNPGVEAFCANDLPRLATQDVPVVVNVSGHSVAEYVEVVRRLETEPMVSAYEINISCPNVDAGGMTFGTDPTQAAAVTAACREQTSRPLILKLTPNVTDITEIARACESAGADALSMINTLAGMSVNSRTRRATFERKVAGLSGPAIKPVALWAVHRTHSAVKIPIIGMGGISGATDVLEFMLAGATAVAIGTNNFSDPLAVPNILASFEQLCEREGVDDVNELIGAID